jgi:CheY-like chemotaxis protein
MSIEKYDAQNKSLIYTEVINDESGEKIAARSKSVLVVDDDPLLVKVLREPLEKSGYRVHTAYNGLEALQKVKAVTPDLIILDILMPLLDGFKVARFLKFDQKYRDIPIVVLTSRATEAEREMGKIVGANEYVCKPVRLPQIMNIVNRYLNA